MLAEDGAQQAVVFAEQQPAGGETLFRRRRGAADAREAHRLGSLRDTDADGALGVRRPNHGAAGRDEDFLENPPLRQRALDAALIDEDGTVEAGVRRRVALGRVKPADDAGGPAPLLEVNPRYVNLVL